MKKTPLSDQHSENGKMVEFAGWHLPVTFEGLRQEHLRVRKTGGFFDVSHMGEIRVRGPESLPTLEWLTTNSVSALKKYQAQYTLLGHPEGGIVDDLIVYCFEPGEDYLLCVNADNTKKDCDWILQNNKGASVTDESSSWGQVAIQGPQSDTLLSALFSGQSSSLNGSVTELPPFCFSPFLFDEEEVIVARTGYTGERGVEVFVPWDKTLSFWQCLLEKGKTLGMEPVGLGARDTLRMEMKYSLYGHEIDETTSPYEAGLGWVVKAQDKDFLGKEAMLESKERGEWALVGFQMEDKGIPRQGYLIFNSQGEEIGRVTSGTLSPSLDVGIGIGYVKKPWKNVGEEIFIQIRTRQIKAVVVKTPFVKGK